MPGIEQAADASPAAASRVDEILRAACRVVVSGGASDLRIGSVAQEAGVSRTLVHYYFTTRQELLRAAFAYAENLRIDALEEELAALTTGAERAELALMRAIDPTLEANPALWNEVWSSLRYDEELRPLVQERYRAWAERIVRLLEEGRRDGSVAPSVDPAAAGWRLAAAADGVDSILYLGLLDREQARALLSSCIDRELER
jgi:AcrR family transcriptional regulator